MVVEIFFGVAGEAVVEEAFVAVLAAIGAVHQDMVKEPLYGANSSRAVSVVGAAMGTIGFAGFRFGFAHGDILAGRFVSYTFDGLASTGGQRGESVFIETQLPLRGRLGSELSDPSEKPDKSARSKNSEKDH